MDFPDVGEGTPNPKVGMLVTYNLDRGAPHWIRQWKVLCVEMNLGRVQTSFLGFAMLIMKILIVLSVIIVTVFVRVNYQLDKILPLLKCNYSCGNKEVGYNIYQESHLNGLFAINS